MPSSSAPRAARYSGRGGLVAAQVALSLLLVIAAGLFIRTFERLLAVPLGFDSDRVLVVEINASRAALAPGARTAVYDQLVTAVAELPGVAAAGASLNTPANHGALLVTEYMAPGMPRASTDGSDGELRHPGLVPHVQRAGPRRTRNRSTGHEAGAPRRRRQRGVCSSILPGYRSDGHHDSGGTRATRPSEGIPNLSSGSSGTSSSSRFALMRTPRSICRSRSGRRSSPSHLKSA